MNPLDDLKDEIETLQCVYSDAELEIDFSSQELARIAYTATLDTDTKLHIQFNIGTTCSISVINHRDSKKTVPSDILCTIQSILTKRYDEEIDSMPIFQCLSFCTDELLTDKRLHLSQQLQKIKLNDDIDPDKIFWSEVAKYRKEFKANGGSLIKYTKIDLGDESLANNGLTLSKEVKAILKDKNCVNRALWKAIPSIRSVTVWAKGKYNAKSLSIKFIATPENMIRFLNSRNQRSTHMEVVFHGTDSRNDNNIIDRGLVVGGTRGVPVTNGRAHGKGVYCTPKMDVANGYARLHGTGGSIFVCLVRKTMCNKSGDIYIVPNDDDILPIYLIHHW
eukprot:196089_1